jgi:hypothetical protein
VTQPEVRPGEEWLGARAGTMSRLIERWPTAVGLVVAAGVCAAVVAGLDVDDVADEFAPGIATMMGIYLAAYATGKPASAWLAFVGLVAVALLVGPLGLDAAIVMTAVLGPLWLWVLAQGLVRDRPWFAVETLGLVFFGGLTIAAVLAEARLAGILAGAGWLTHGVWDAYHFAKDRVVARSWSEMCAVVDIPIGTALIVVSIVG